MSMFSFKIPYITVVRFVYILAESMCVLISIVSPKQTIACSEVVDRLQIIVVSTSVYINRFRSGLLEYELLSTA